ncbi:hypothetical protein B296_00027542, partial [Ensete ventricosum]
MRAVCNQAVPPKIDRWRSISVIDRRLREKLIVGGRLREKKERRSEKYEEEKRKKYLLARAPSSLAGRLRIITARGSPACRRRPRPRA